ncbi:thioredoxin-disulfide reductase [bacterium]|nr:thioredoxin-disulfide reductase [bacterium]
MNEEMYDVIIIGGGPAGLTSAIYTSRERLKTLVLEKAICGGLPATTELVENYPGFPEGISGVELMKRFKEQAMRFGTEIREFNEVKKIEHEDKIFKVETNYETYRGSTVIVASGSVPKKLNVPGEEEFIGRGVSYCAICDGPFYQNKDIAIIGCGNSGLQEGETLLKYVKSITFVEFLPYIPAEKILQERVSKDPRVRFFLNHIVTAINGDTAVQSITIKNRETGEEKEIKVDGVFVYVGFLPNTKFLEGLVELDKQGYIITDEDMRTSHPGIYAVGDVRSKKIRQIAVACGEGTIAAIAVRDYLKELER